MIRQESASTNESQSLLISQVQGHAEVTVNDSELKQFELWALLK